MDHDNTGGVVCGGFVDCSHNHCDFDLVIHLPHNFEERYFCTVMNNISCTHVFKMHVKDSSL